MLLRPAVQVTERRTQLLDWLHWAKVRNPDVAMMKWSGIRLSFICPGYCVDLSSQHAEEEHLLFVLHVADLVLHQQFVGSVPKLTENVAHHPLQCPHLHSRRITWPSSCWHQKYIKVTSRVPFANTCSLFSNAQQIRRGYVYIKILQGACRTVSAWE